MLQGTVRQIEIMPKFILYQNAKFSTRQYFRLYGTSDSVKQVAENNIVPRTTLQDRISEKVIHGSKPAPTPYPNREES